jgi:uncharacterized protein
MYSLIIIPILVAIVTQIIKLITDSIPNNLNWQHLFNDYGGMPSSHTALVSSLTLMAGLNYGFDSGYFAIAFIFMIIVVRDAVGFRREIGKNAILTNMIAQEIWPENPEVLLQERIGHTRKEVIVGMIVGIALTLAFYWLMLVI